MISTILTFILGCIVGWFTNHWYSVNLKEPQLSQNGSSGGSSIFGTISAESVITSIPTRAFLCRIFSEYARWRLGRR